MLRSAGRFLLAAKTSVKEVAKVRAGSKKDVKVVRKVIDTTKWHHNKWPGNHIFQLINALPQPPKDAPRSTWLHKGGFGLKFYRPLWVRYPEPCYWTIAKYKPAQKGSPPRVWGFKTWRGVTEPLPRRIPGVHRKQWRILLEPGTQLGPSKDNCWTAPEVTLTSDPKLSTQLPEDLPGARASAWPYPWGKLGTRNFPVSEVTQELLTEEAEAEAQLREEIAAQMESDRADFLDAPPVVVELDAEGRLVERIDVEGDGNAKRKIVVADDGQVSESLDGEGAAAPPVFDASSIEVEAEQEPNLLEEGEDVDEDEDEALALDDAFDEDEDAFETQQDLDDAADAEEQAEKDDDAKREAAAKTPTQ